MELETAMVFKTWNWSSKRNKPGAEQAHLQASLLNSTHE